ncbi:unnamed protein product [Cylindrotheca closterium]|uniref:Prolyl 4-hydroxylase alpha subunit domain-containing protein n=1 Tax=Cylindrotheca closterium TaxID=2856 RepID=A0AAD2GCT6_9STRA|nr:unnamed protein product [Cylindrotheca closterium]
MKSFHFALGAFAAKCSILLWSPLNPSVHQIRNHHVETQAFLERQQCLDIDNRDECQVENVPSMSPPDLHRDLEECKNEKFPTMSPHEDLHPAPEEEEVEEDPMLEQMPTANFKAYKRQDISSMYQEPPGSRIEKNMKYQGIAAKFINMSPQLLDLTYDNSYGPPGGDIIAHVVPGGSGGTSTFPNHMYYFVKPETQEVVCSMKTRKGTSIYYCDPFVKTEKDDPSAGVVWGPQWSLDVLNEQERNLYNRVLYNREFGGLYENFTGSPWYGQFPQEPPRHHMHRADYFGQVHTVVTAESHFTSLPPEDELYRKLSVVEMMRNDTSSIPFQAYREEGKKNMTITAVSVAPRIFQIDGFLSEVEADHIIELAKRKTMRRSTTGVGADEQVTAIRTSETTWLPRHYSPVMDAIFKRAADALKIDEALMRYRLPGEQAGADLPSRVPICEPFQVNHYPQGTEFDVHTDHGYPDTRPNEPSRSINIVIYLNEGMKGGETAFPRWRNADTDEAVAATPEKGKAMIFYMKNPDGNMDDLSQHSANPLIEGEKWFANLWTWDPFREE